VVRFARNLEKPSMKRNMKSRFMRSSPPHSAGFFFFFFPFIKCMQPMAMALSIRCVYAKLHVTWPKSMLYIFPLSSHTNRMRIRARWFKILPAVLPFSFFPSQISSLSLPFLIAIFWLQFKYFSSTLALRFYRFW